jgi:hypothetical protein
VEFFGYGIYEGDFIPTEAVGFIAQVLREAKHANPRIKLDNGGVVYGCECWWGEEGRVKDLIKEKTDAGVFLRMVDIDKIRRKVRIQEVRHNKNTG